MGPSSDSEYRMPILQAVKVGDELRLQVKGMGTQGDFYGTHMGLVIFIKGLKKCSVGDQLSVRITNVFKNCAFAEVPEKV
jgi:predicted RNA-binding protein with TRAM domain